MRCKCCDRPGALMYDPPVDIYCQDCLEVIFTTIGKDFTLSDVQRIILGEDENEIKNLTKG